MIEKEIKQRASDKIYAKYLRLLREELLDPEEKYWSIDKERAIELNKAHSKEIEVYSYILSLIEKDNKL
jgi:septum formation topological specificity factor MinE